MEEEDLVKQCSAKDRAAQQELYTRYAARLLTLCRRYSDSKQEAEDILHDTFLIAFDPSYRSNTKERARYMPGFAG